MDIADENWIVFCCGGIGHIMVPSEQYDAFTMPSKIEHLMLFLIAVPDASADCIMGYFFDPVNKRIIPDKTAAIKAALGSVDYQINCDIDLWN